MRHIASLLSIATASLLSVATPRDAQGAQCCGDCNSSGSVSIDELVTAVSNDLHGCALPLDLRQAFLDAPDVQSCAASLAAGGFAAGEVETTGAIDSQCDTSTCEGSLLAIQHFASNDGRGKSIVAVVTFHLSGGGAPTVQVVHIAPFDNCTP